MTEEQTNILMDAATIVHGDRREAYGHAKESFGRIANLWSCILGVNVTPDQVAMCLIQLKIARFINSQDRDSVVDIAGYAACLGQLHDW